MMTGGGGGTEEMNWEELGEEKRRKMGRVHWVVVVWG